MIAECKSTLDERVGLHRVGGTIHVLDFADSNLLERTMPNPAWQERSSDAPLCTPYTPNPEPETRDPKLEIRKPKTETRNPRPETRDPRLETRNPKLDTRNPKPDTTNPQVDTRRTGGAGVGQRECGGLGDGGRGPR